MSKIALSIYLQVSSTTIGFVNEEGQCLGSQTFDKPITSVQSIIELCEQLQARFQVVTFHKIGIVSNRELQEQTEIIEKLSSYFHVKATHAHTGAALAQYEHQWGNTQHEGNFFAISIQSTIDGAIFLNGKLAQGSEGLAANISHLLVHNYMPSQPLYTYFTEEGIKKMASKMIAESAAHSPLQQISFAELTVSTIIDAAANDDEVALQVFETLGEILGLKLSDIMNYFSPKYFIINSYSKAFTELLITYAKPKLQNSLFPVFKGKPEILASKSQEGDFLTLQAAAIAF